MAMFKEEHEEIECETCGKEIIVKTVTTMLYDNCPHCFKHSGNPYAEENINKEYKPLSREVLVALIGEMVDAEESSDGENRAIYANVAKMVIDNEFYIAEKNYMKLQEAVDEAHEKGYRSGYKINW